MERLYAVVYELEDLFPSRHFTPDGHLVGSIGEVWAEYLYDLDLLTASAMIHDAISKDGRNVQVKATQGARVALSSEPEHLIVLLLRREKEPEEIYNGPGAGPWMAAGNIQKNGQRSIGSEKLRSLMKKVKTEDKIPQIRGEELT